MKLALVFAAVLVCALAAPAEDKDAQVIKFDLNIEPSGNFESRYDTSNGIKSEDSGVLTEGFDQENKPLSYLVRAGRYTYVDNEGKTHSVSWTADEKGYNAQSDDIPVALAYQPN